MENKKKEYVPFVLGENIDLVVYTKDDASMITRWMTDPEVTSYLSFGNMPMRLEDEEAFLEKMYISQTDIMLGIYVKNDKRVIGSVGLHKVSPRDRTGVFGIVIGEKGYWGKGHGLEATNLLLKYAFNVRNLHKVKLDVIADNERAITCYQHAGFKEIGRRKDEIFKEGVYKDMVLMEIFRDETIALQSA